MDEFRPLTRDEIRAETLARVRAEYGDAEADALAALSPPCVETSHAGRRRPETHTVTYDGDTITVAHANGSRGQVSRGSVQHQALTDALFEVLRCPAPLEPAPASTLLPGTVAAIQRGLDRFNGSRCGRHEAHDPHPWTGHGPGRPEYHGRSFDCPGIRPPYDDDPDGDNWAPADVKDEDKADCRRCGEPIVWEGWNGPGFWVTNRGGTEACTPGPDDMDRHHAPTSTPTPTERERMSTMSNSAPCTCVTSCADDPDTACSLSGVPHVHPNQHPGDVFGPCPVHPDAPGDL